jgi:hypothetical protein
MHPEIRIRKAAMTATSRHSSGPREEYETGRGGQMIIVIDVVAPYALCAYDSRTNLGTARPA